jgi:periplasmic divalent cation tolerance protein
VQDKYIVTFVTCPHRGMAESISKALIEKRLAGCISIFPGVSSIYRWEGKIQQSKEVLLMIKTHSRLYRKLEKEIKKLHSYEVPEIISLEIKSGSHSYLKWIDESII